MERLHEALFPPLCPHVYFAPGLQVDSETWEMLQEHISLTLFKEGGWVAHGYTGAKIWRWHLEEDGLVFYRADVKYVVVDTVRSIVEELIRDHTILVLGPKRYLTVCSYWSWRLAGGALPVDTELSIKWREIPWAAIALSFKG